MVQKVEGAVHASDLRARGGGLTVRASGSWVEGLRARQGAARASAATGEAAVPITVWAVQPVCEAQHMRA